MLIDKVFLVLSVPLNGQYGQVERKIIDRIFVWLYKDVYSFPSQKQKNQQLLTNDIRKKITMSKYAIKEVG